MTDQMVAIIIIHKCKLYLESLLIEPVCAIGCF